MVFPCQQHRHALIPRARHPEAELELADETRQFRAALMQLIQRRLEELGPGELHDPGAGQDGLQQHWPRLRRQLDRCPRIRAANARRSQLQDRLWATVLEAIADDRDRLEAVFERQRKGPGELVLDPDLVVPAHQLQTDIHRMPGGYLQDRAEDGFLTGVLYDHGVFLYGQGWLGPCNDAIGRTLIASVLAEHHSSLQPRRILDLGCSVGHSTLPYVQAFPEAEVWGIDLGASLLRHASVRARLLNLPCHFAQQDAERTGFEDGSFDLIVSHILLHEIPGSARRRLFAESHRLLRPGGIMVHLDSALFLSPATAVSRYFRDTEVAANGEPFLASSSLDAFPRYALEAGFAPDRFQIRAVPGSPTTAPAKAPPAWLAFCAEKS
jgi:SAM-dependent methyltransferase